MDAHGPLRIRLSLVERACLVERKDLFTPPSQIAAGSAGASPDFDDVARVVSDELVVPRAAVARTVDALERAWASPSGSCQVGMYLTLAAQVRDAARAAGWVVR